MASPERSGRRTRVGAAVDVGSNSVHLVVGLVGASGVRALVDESELLGLGDVVDREGHIPTDSCDAIVRTLERYAATSAAYGAESVTFVATEPLRRATNSADVLARVLAATGRPLHVLSHEAEARLTLLGVTGGVPGGNALMVVDIGGGSTEIISIDVGSAEPMVGVLPTGSSRLTKALVVHDPPTWFEINALRAEAKRLVDGLQARPPADGPVRCVMVGGTASNLVKLVSGPVVGGSARTVGGLVRKIDLADLPASFDLLAREPADALVIRFAVNRRRAGQLAAGAALVEALMVRYSVSRAEISAASLREGTILAVAEAGDEWPAWFDRSAARG
jgi:exopolyphosphatase/guanosine-5'-triphosphate,3'-diphosphate pyrophosphatase